MKIENLKFDKRGHGSAGAMVFFKNGYGASVITGGYSFTTKTKPYEIAVLEGDKSNNEITYKTTITDDVIGYLTEAAATTILKRIEALADV